MPVAYIALGANLPSPAGPPESTLAAAAERFTSLGRVTARSSLYSTTPVGPPHEMIDQPRYLNAVVALETSLAPDQLLHALLAIERRYGRNRSSATPNGPRTLDLDILLIGDLIIREFDLQVPHPRFAERAFVLVPLNEIAPQLRDPRSGATVSELFQRLQHANPQASNHSTDAVVPVQSEIWRAGVFPDPGAADSPRPGAG
jgi:2-amino-4-hydroxy-6-hydroxymethyldihydropteridine diphosphokinase